MYNVRITSPDVARRLRGMGFEFYVIDPGKPTERVFKNAYEIRHKGFDLAALCVAGRLYMEHWKEYNGAPKTTSEARRIVNREVRRQRRDSSGNMFMRLWSKRPGAIGKSKKTKKMGWFRRLIGAIFGTNAFWGYGSEELFKQFNRQRYK